MTAIESRGNELSAGVPRLAGLAGFFTTVAILVAVFAGWVEREENLITPSGGLGYWLGIIGSLMMVALLFYSYRKRQRRGMKVGSIPTWFRIHMALGIAGPLLVVFHSNFQLKALNSTVALGSMLTVASSGLIGRYIYGKIHGGLDGNKRTVRLVQANLKLRMAELGAEAEPIFEQLEAFGRNIMERPGSNALDSLALGAIGVVRSSWMRFRLHGRLRRLVDTQGRGRGWNWRERFRRARELRLLVDSYFVAILRVAQLRFFERLFSLWHMFHLPLFAILVMTALIHVWAVHRY